MPKADNKIETVLHAWRMRSASLGLDFPVEALYRLAVPAILSHLRPHDDARTFFKACAGSSAGRGRKRTLTMSGWYLLWSIKWMYFRLFSGKSAFIIASLLPDRPFSNAYREAITTGARARRAAVIHFGILQDRTALCDPDFHCFPHLLYKFRFRKEIDAQKEKLAASEEILRELVGKKAAASEAGGILDPRDADAILSMNYTFRSLLDILSALGTTAGLVQDIDFTGERVIFASACAEQGIPTVCFDHAVLFLSQAHTESRSRYHCVWGEHEKDRLMSSQQIPPDQICITGRPGFRFTQRHLRGSERWIYFLPSLSDPLMMNPDRSIAHALRTIARIQELVRVHYPGIRFYIKPHPADRDTKILQQFPILPSGPLDSLVAGSQLVFVEESTVAIELLQYDIPVIYAADESDAVHLDPEAIAAFSLLCGSDDAQAVCDAALLTPIDWTVRENAARHYFGTGEAFDAACQDAFSRWMKPNGAQ